MSGGQRLGQARRSLADLDAVTIDANGTLVELVDPVPALLGRLRERGVERRVQEVRAAFEAEAAYYVPRSLEGRDEASLAALREDCARVFLDALGADLDAAEFAAAYVAALVFRPADRVPETLRALRARGLALAVVSNWDCSLAERLDEVGLAPFFDAVVCSAEAAVAKPDPAIFELALARLGVRPERALHIGDGDADERGAAAAGLYFAPAPLANVLEKWT